MDSKKTMRQYAGLLVVNAFIFWKKILPAYTEAFES